jgi:hypothetical protein
MSRCKERTAAGSVRHIIRKMTTKVINIIGQSKQKGHCKGYDRITTEPLMQFPVSLSLTVSRA